MSSTPPPPPRPRDRMVSNGSRAASTTSADSGNRPPSASGAMTTPRGRHRRYGSHGGNLPPRTLSLLERQWSHGNVFLQGTGGAPPPPGPLLSSTESPFQQSWSSTIGNASMTTSGNNSMLLMSQHSFSSSASSDINLLGGGGGGGSFVGSGTAAGAAASVVSAMLTPSASQEDDVADSMLDAAIMMDPNISVIHDAARLTNWDTVLKLCQEQPQYAHYAGPDGWTALHHACNRRCPRADVVEALIRAYPDAMLDLEEKGMTPLHYACRFKAPREAVRLLLELFPRQGRAAVSRRDKKGRTPLYYATRYDAPDGVVELLLQVDPSVVLEEQTRDANTSPLALAWTVWAEKLEGRTTLRPFLSSSSVADGEEAATASMRPTSNTPAELLELLKTKDKLYKNWKKVHKLLRAAYGFHKPEQGENREFRILHATASIQCHPSLFRLALALHPEQAPQHDHNDLTPEECTVLHLAAGSCATGDLARLVIGSMLELYPAALSVPDAATSSLPLHIIVEKKHHYQDDGIQQIYEAHPQAASVPDAYGRLALHRAAGAARVSSKTLSSQPDDHGNNGNNDNAINNTINNAEEIRESSIIINLVRLHPEAASVTDNCGRLPLHWIAQESPTWTRECQAIYDAHPAAIRSRTGRSQHHRLAIHLAAGSPNAKYSLLSRLVELHPRAASQPDSTGKLPLHICCETGKEFNQELYEAFPNAVREAEDNDRAWTALQMAAACPTEDESSSSKSRQQSSSVPCLINKLVELNPEAAYMVDKKHGRTALHWACASGKEWDTGLEALLKAHPDAMLLPDKTGCLPFHVAALRYCKVQKEEEDKDPPPVFKNRSTLRARSAPPRPEFTNHVEVLFELLRARPDILAGMMV